MQIDATKLEQIQSMLLHEDSAVSFFRHGSDSAKGYWYVTRKEISEAGAWDEKADALESYDRRSDASFLEFAKNDLDAEVTIYYDGRRGYDQETFTDWEHLARYLGIADMVAISTKLPKPVEKKFRYYASKEGTVSEVLRGLVYKYVEESIKDNAQRDMFRG